MNIELWKIAVSWLLSFLVGAGVGAKFMHDWLKTIGEAEKDGP